MTRKLLLQPYENGASESLEWKTNVLDTTGHDEQRIAIRDYPDEKLSVVMRFGDDGQSVFANEIVNYLSGADAIVRNLRDLILARDEITIARWEFADVAAAETFTSGTRIISVSFFGYSPFQACQDEYVIAQAAGAWYRGKVVSFDGTLMSLVVDFGANTGLTASQFGAFVPLRDGLIDSSAAKDLARAAPADSVKFDVLLSRNKYRTKLANTGFPLNFGNAFGLPVLDVRGVQDSFGIDIRQGTQKVETASGFPFYVSYWKEAGFGFSIRDEFRRVAHAPDEYASNVFFDKFAPDFYFRGDDPRAAIDGGKLLQLPTYGAGAVLRVVSATPTLAPDVGTVNGIRAPELGVATAPLNAVSVAGSAVFQDFHRPGTDGTIVMIMYFKGNESTTSRPFSTRSSTAGALGTLIRRGTSGALQFQIGDGTVEQVNFSVASILAGSGLFVVIARKVGLTYEVFVNGVSVGFATAASLAAGTASTASFGGTRDAIGTSINGMYCEFAYFARAITNTEIGQISIYSRRWSMPVNAPNLRRMSGRLQFWRAFLDACKGAQRRFWLPSRRSDFEIVSLVGTFGIVLKGRQYFDLWNETNLKALCLDSGLDAIYIMQVVDVELDANGNSAAQYQSSTPFLNPVVQVSMAFPCRLSDDSVAFTHNQLTSEVSINAVSVNFDLFTPFELPTPLVEVRSDDLGAVMSGTEFVSMLNLGSLGGNFNDLGNVLNRPNSRAWRGRRAAAFTTSNDSLESSLAASSYNFLRTAAQSYCTFIRFELTAWNTAGGSNYLYQNSGLSYYVRVDVDTQRIEHVGRPSRSFNSAAGLIAIGNQYTLVHAAAPSADYWFLSTNGGPLVLIGTQTTATSNATMATTLSISRATGSSAKALIPHFLIYGSGLLNGSRNYVAAQLEALWPTRTALMLSIDGSDVDADFDADFTHYDSIPIRGELPGSMIPVGLAGPTAVGVNLLSAPLFESDEFDPLSVASIDPVVWVEADGASFTGTMLPGGTSPPFVQVFGTSSPEFQGCKLRTPIAGIIGISKIQASFDGGLTWTALVLTAPNMTFGPFTAVLDPAGNYQSDNVWEALPEQLLDVSGEANHMNSVVAPLIVPRWRNGRAAFSPSLGYFVTPLFTGARSITGDMLIVLVGNSGPSPANVIPAGGVTFMRDVRTNASAQPCLVSTVVAGLAGVIAPNTDFIWVGLWDGAASTILYMQAGLADISGTVNPGDPAALGMTQIAFGAHASGVQPAVGWKLAAMFLAEVPGALPAADYQYLAQGFADRYGFPQSTFVSDALESSIIDPASLTFLHNNSQNWQLSLAAHFEATMSDLLVAFESVRSSGTGFRLSFLPLTSQIRIETLGTAGTFAGVVSLPALANTDLVVELLFTSGGTPSIAVWVNDLLVGTITPVGFTFSTSAQDRDLVLGLGRGFVLCETIVRSDFTSQADYLRRKWFPRLWAGVPIDAGGYAPIDVDGFAPVGG